MGTPTRPAGRCATVTTTIGAFIAVTTTIGAVLAVAAAAVAAATATTAAAALTAATAVAAVAVAAVAARTVGGRPGLSFRGVVSSLIRCSSRASARVRGACAGRAMRTAAWLMPPAVRDRWLGEAESFLFEAPPGQQAEAIRNYLITAPQVIAASWAVELLRRARRRDRVTETPQKAPRG